MEENMSKWVETLRTPRRGACNLVRGEVGGSWRWVFAWLLDKMGQNRVKVPVQLLLIFAKLFSSSKKTEPKNVSLDQLIALDDVIDMGRRLDAFTKSVKVGGGGKKPIIISIEKWIVKLIGGVGKSATRSLKNTTNGREKGLKLRVKVVATSEQNIIT
ncbi:hypothetical protein Tco_0167702 [Tanacetum coccineum]